MVNEKKVKLLNEALIENSGAVGPSLVYLSLFGPIRGYLDPITIEYLNIRLNQIDDSYKNFILPKSKNIFKLFEDPFYSTNIRKKETLEEELNYNLSMDKDLKDQFKINLLEEELHKINRNIFPQCKKDLEERLEKVDFEEIREIYKKKFVENQFHVPEDVKQELFDSVYLQKNQFVDFIINENSIYSFRSKNLRRSFEKYVTRYLELNKEDKKLYLNLITDIASDPFEFWTVYSDYQKKGYSNDILEATMAGDVFGMKEIMLSDNIAKTKISQLKQNKSRLDLNGFDVVL